LILFAVLIASFTPIALPLSMGLGAIAAGNLVYATVQAVMREDISWVGASLVWLAGAAFSTLLLLASPENLGDYGLVLGSILLLLAMLPFFTTASAIRNLRAN
jgi:small neutral amino acid transporter SnatA (MarC family)